ncbi:MAG: flippase-like domain-containing protein [Bacteroidia bacterium]|nr:flippase-like domain-containing protein [Bacteroidia bacterium]
MLGIIRFNKYSIFWAIKLIIVTLCFIFLSEKLQKINFTMLFSLFAENTVKSKLIVSLIFILFFINWGIETTKWKYLIRKIESISFKNAFLAVMGGVAISTFTLNRTGEFAGRMMFLKDKLNIGIAALTVFGSISQLFFTILFGSLSIALVIKEYNFSELLKLNINYLTISVLIVAIILICYLVINRNKQSIKSVFKINNIITNIFKALSMLSFKDITLAFGMSFLRYIVFILQFYFILKLFGISLSFIQIITILPTIFIVQTIIPTFFITEIGVRISAALLILENLGFNETKIIASTTLLWLINIAFAALTGAIAILLLKYKKAKE